MRIRDVGKRGAQSKFCSGRSEIGIRIGDGIVELVGRMREIQKGGYSEVGREMASLRKIPKLRRWGGRWPTS